MQQTFVVYTKDIEKAAELNSKYISGSCKFCINDRVISPSELYKMASISATDYFYVINSEVEMQFTNFDFSFGPPEWDNIYVHIWNNDFRIKLYNTNLVLQNPHSYSDAEIEKGNVRLKFIDQSIYSIPKADIVFISYHEANADENWKLLKSREPLARRVHGMKGIVEAHKLAAKISTTTVLYIVDADAVIDNKFNFEYYPAIYDIDCVHVWKSRNPVNNLLYGYGGVKMFPRDLLIGYTGLPIDFTTSVSSKFKVMPEVSNISAFNVDAYSAWRSGFRECTKLAAKLIHNQDNTETEERLRVWCTVGKDELFGEYAIKGAKEGMAYGLAHTNQPDMLGLINDYAWLENRFKV